MALEHVIAHPRGRVVVEQVDGDVARALAELRRRARCRRSSRRATSTSDAPGSRASRRAVASPMPLEAPVTSITRRVAWCGCCVCHETASRSLAWCASGARALAVSLSDRPPHELTSSASARRERARPSRSARKREALELFRGLPRRYDRLSAALSFWQDPRWRRALVDALGAARGRARARRRDRHRDGRRRAALALRAARSWASTRARRCWPPRARASPRRRLAASSWSRARPSAARSPTRASTRSPSPTCCATSTTPRRRCASSPAWCARAGGVASLEFGVPPSRRRARRGGCTPPSACRCSGGLVSREWREVGRFLGPEHPRLLRAPSARADRGYWREAGLERRRACGG